MLSFNRLERQKLIIASFSLREMCPNTELFLVHCSANQWTGFYMITASVMKELKDIFIFYSKSIYTVFMLNWEFIIQNNLRIFTFFHM